MEVFLDLGDKNHPQRARVINIMTKALQKAQISMIFTVNKYMLMIHFQHLRATNGTPFSAGLFPAVDDSKMTDVEVVNQGKVWKGAMLGAGQQNGRACYKVQCVSGGKKYDIEVMHHPKWYFMILLNCTVEMFQLYDGVCIRKATSPLDVATAADRPTNPRHLLRYQKVKSSSLPGASVGVGACLVRRGTIQYFDPIKEHLGVFFKDNCQVETVRYVDVSDTRK